MVFSTTYQSCKNSLVSKLNSVGINANESEGLTTLINKINLINDGIFLWTDDTGTSRSSSDSGTIYAMIVENGVFKSNTNILFCGISKAAPTQRTNVINEELQVGCKYTITNIPNLNNGEYIYLDKEHRIKLAKDAYGATGIFWTLSDYGQGNGSCLGISSVIVENNIIKLTYSGLNTTINASRCDMSAILSNISITINDYSTITTDSNGIGSFDFEFDGEEEGTKTITARCGNKMGTLEFTIS